MKYTKVAILLVGFVITFLPASIKTSEQVNIWEPIPVEQEQDPVVEVEQEGVFARTHDVKINDFSIDEAQDLLKIAQAEAGNQGEEGMWLVMSVIFNRRKFDNYPNSIHEVIYQSHQFSSVTNGSINKVEVSAEAHTALARLERGEVAPQIVGFETLESDVLDQYFIRAFEFKDHRFYTEK